MSSGALTELFPALFPLQSLACSIEQTKTKYRVQCDESVAPGDLFSLRVRTAGVRNRNFENAPAAFGDFGGHLGFESKAIRAQPDAANYFAAKNLITRFHVGDV